MLSDDIIRARKIFMDNCTGSDEEAYRTELGFYLSTGHVFLHENTACHAGLYACYFGGELCLLNNREELGELDRDDKEDYLQNMVAIFSSIVNDETPTEIQLQFADWLLNRSVWKYCFLSRDPQDVIDNQCWVLDPDAPSGLLSGACMATRHITEWPTRTMAWVEMVKQGVREDLAYLLSHHFNSLGGWDDPYPFVIDTTYAWHIPVHKWLTRKYIDNFLNNNPRVDEPYRESGTYNQVSNIWGREGVYIYFDSIKPRGYEHKTDKKSLNIFYKPKKVSTNYQFTSPEQLKNLVEDMEKMIDETT